MANVLIIGFGSLGFRHAESLISTPSDILEIHIVHPSEESKKKTEDLIVANKSSIQIHYHESINTIQNQINFNLCIVATTAKPREKILLEIYNLLDIKYFLLEKVLFQSVSQTERCAKALRESSERIWINCARRSWPIYKKINEILINEKTINLTCHANKWNMASNSIHLIDLWCYLKNSNSFELSTTKLLPEIFESKRKGYYEFFGLLTATSGQGEISLKARNSDLPVDFIIVIKSENFKIIVNESKKQIRVEHIVSSEIEEESFNIPYQSELTYHVYQELISSGTSSLTSFNDSIEIHKNILAPLAIFFNTQLNSNSSICPIT